MYLSTEELKSAIYNDKIAYITEDDTSITEQAVAAAIEEVRSYLSTRYDAEAVFAAEGAERNALVLETVKVVAVWQIIKLCNSEMIYEQWRERYDRSIKFLVGVADGKITPSLPVIKRGGQPSITSRFGSNTKFNHHL